MKSVKVFILTVICCFLVGCSEKNAIVGTWDRVSGSEYDDEMIFYEDGTCLNTPVDSHSNRAESYKIQEDGTLFFYTSYGDTVTYAVADTEQEALESREVYFLSKDLLVLCTNKYTRK